MILLAWLEDPLSVAAVVSMLIFFGVFLGVIVWLLTRSRREVDNWSKMPLDDDPPPGAK